MPETDHAGLNDLPVARTLVMRTRFALLAFSATLLGCQPTTSRPSIVPYPEAARTEVRLSASEATRRLAEALRRDTIPIAQYEQRDGYLDSDWFMSQTGTWVKHRPLGEDVVRVRAWAERARPYATLLIVETVYHPMADPSLPERDLDRPVSNDHPVAKKIRATLDSLVARYGGVPGGTSAGVKTGTGTVAPVQPTAPAKPAAPAAPPKP